MKRLHILILISAIAMSCGSGKHKESTVDTETLITQISYNHRIIESQDGKRKYRFETPLVERYQQAKVPYTEYRKGIKVETFNDSLQVESTITADYARYDETAKLWEARGNVIVRNLPGSKALFTEQLFWDEAKEKIYTKKRARVIDGEQTHIGIGFETDQDFEMWSFNNAIGQIEVQNPSDSTARATTEVDSTAIGGATTMVADTTSQTLP